MLQAYTDQGQYLSAHQVDCTKANDLFFCPSCKGRVFLKKGTIKVPHFAHYQKTDCKSFSEGETEEHLKGKILLKKFFESLGYKVVLEGFLTSLDQRPDLLVRRAAGSYLAIEFQCSRISQSAMIRRSEGYQSLGIDVIWILGQSFHFQGKLTPFMKLSIRKYTKLNALVLTQLKVKAQSLEWLYQFQRIGKNGNFTYHKITHPISTTKFKHSYFCKGSSPSLRNQSDDLIKHFIHKTSTSLPFFNQIYQEQESLISIPVELYQFLPSEWMIQSFSYEWKYLLLKWLEKFPKGRVIPVRQLKSYLSTRSKIKWFSMPLIDQSYKFIPIEEYLVYLESKDLLRYDCKTITILKKAKRFKTWEEKFNFFEKEHLCYTID